MNTLFDIAPPSPLAIAEAQRVGGHLYAGSKKRSELGQYATPATVAQMAAGMLSIKPGKAVRLLDAGIGAGALSLAVAERADNVTVFGFDVDRDAVALARRNLALGGVTCEIAVGDYLNQPSPATPYTHAILNPPYKKLPASDPRQVELKHQGIHAVNLYIAFVWKAILELEPGGQLVAIIPRSFANGTYYRPFRQFLRAHTELIRIHVFRERDQVFSRDAVLQENVIVSLRRRSRNDSASSDQVLLTSSAGLAQVEVDRRRVGASELWWDTEGACLMRLTLPPASGTLPEGCLSDLGIEVSTGPVVDFRVSEHLRHATERSAFPLLRPRHFAAGRCRWPEATGKREGGIAFTPETEKFFWPKGNYVVVRRISSKEESRRVVASVLFAEDLSTDQVCFENHLNVYHRNNAGLEAELTIGLCNYLNSTVVDEFIRSVSGHTQVNATDLRALPYPTLDTLINSAKRSQWQS